LQASLMASFGLALAVPELAGADEAAASSTPVQLSLIEDLQLFDADRSVEGARLGLSSRNQDVTGFDLGMVSARTSGDQIGVQLAPYCDVEGDLRGGQLGAIAVAVDGGAEGVQLAGLSNRVGELTGGQLAFVFNRALSVVGVQIALVNYTRDLEGAQLGLININRGGLIPVLPGINVGF
jgi:hypothetical protein